MHSLAKVLHHFNRILTLEQITFVKVYREFPNSCQQVNNHTLRLDIIQNIPCVKNFSNIFFPNQVLCRFSKGPQFQKPNKVKIMHVLCSLTMLKSLLELFQIRSEPINFVKPPMMGQRDTN